MKFYGWEVIRLFISSTFRDFHAERDYLVKYVFPLVREWGLPWRLNVVEIDLRWGVTEAEAENGKVLELCLKGIDQSRPFFICLLGERYGWIPNSEDIDSETIDLYPDVANNIDCSVTHLEILHAALHPLNSKASPLSHSLFYFRDSEDLKKAKDYPGWSSSEREIFNNTFFDSENNDKTDSLKETIRSSANVEHVSNYHPLFDSQADNPEDKELKGRITKESLEEFGKKVASDIIGILEKEYADRISAIKESRGDYSLNNIVANELSFHDSFALNRTRFFVGRRELIQKLGDYVSGFSQEILGVFGETGSGKSTLLSHFYRLLIYYGYSDFYKYEEDAFPDFDIVVAHFVGASRQSTSLYDTLARLVLSIDSDVSIPVNLHQLQQTFMQILEQSNLSILIIIDAVNQMEETGDAYSLWWLPRVLPPNVKIIVSALESKSAEALRELCSHPLIVGPLIREEQKKIVRELPSVYAKTIDDALVDKIIDKKAAISPLYLQAAIGELRVFGSFELLPEYIEKLPDDQIELFAFMLDRIERENEKNAPAIRRLFCSLACARQGLTEKEISMMMRKEGDDEQYLVVLRQIREYLLERGETRGYFHDTLTAAVKMKYGLNCEEEKSFHSEMGDFFAAMPWIENYIPNRRKCYELAYHYFKARRQYELINLIGEYEWMNATLLSLGIQEILRTLEWVDCENITPEIKLLNSFFRLAAFALTQEPRQLASQIWGRLKSISLPTIDNLLTKATNSQKEMWLKPMSAFLHHPDGALIAVLGGFVARVSAVALSPDSATAYAFSNDDTLNIWDVNTTANLRSLGGHPFATNSGYPYNTRQHHMLISQNGKRAVVQDVHLDNENSYIFWDLENQRRLEYSSMNEDDLKLNNVIKEDCKSFYNGTFSISPSGNTMVHLTTIPNYIDKVDKDGRKIRKLEYHRILRVFNLGNDRMTLCMNIDNDFFANDSACDNVPNNYCAPLDHPTCDDEYALIKLKELAINIINLKTGKLCGSIFSEQGVRTDSKVISSLGLIVVLKGSKINLHNVEGVLLETLTEYDVNFHDICFTVSLLGEMAVCIRGKIEIWNLNVRKLMRVVCTDLPKPLAISLSLDGHHVITGDSGGMVYVWDTDSNHDVKEDVSFKPVICLLPISNNIVASLSNVEIAIWNIEEQRIISKATVNTFFDDSSGTSKGIRGISLTQDGKTIIGHDAISRRYIGNNEDNNKKNSQSGLKKEYKNPVFVYKLADGSLTEGITIKDLKKKHRSLALYSNEDIANLNHVMEAKELLSDISKYTMLYVSSLSPDKTLLLISLGQFYDDKEQYVGIWDAKTMKPLLKFEGHTMRVKQGVFSPCGQYVYTASLDKSLCVWRVSDGVCIYRFFHDHALSCIAITPDGKTLIVGDGAGKTLFLKVVNSEHL